MNIRLKNENLSNLLLQDVMVVGEPTLMGGEFGDEDERLITRLENQQFDNPTGADEEKFPNSPSVQQQQQQQQQQQHNSPWGGQDKKPPIPTSGGPPVSEGDSKNDWAFIRLSWALEIHEHTSECVVPVL